MLLLIFCSFKAIWSNLLIISLNYSNSGTNTSLELSLLLKYPAHLIYVHVLDPASAAVTQANKEEADSRSVFVGNVRIRFLSSVHTSPFSKMLFFYEVWTCVWYIVFLFIYPKQKCLIYGFLGTASVVFFYFNISNWLELLVLINQGTYNQTFMQSLLAVISFSFHISICILVGHMLSPLFSQNLQIVNNVLFLFVSFNYFLQICDIFSYLYFLQIF